MPPTRTEPVTTLKRQAAELLADIERDKQTILITRHGRPSAYLVDVETFELLQQRMAASVAWMQHSKIQDKAVRVNFPGLHFIPSGLRVLIHSELSGTLASCPSP